MHRGKRTHTLSANSGGHYHRHRQATLHPRIRGITSRGGDNRSYSELLRHVGNALNAHQCYQILCNLSTVAPVWEATSCPMSLEFYSNAQLEHLFAGMSDS